MTVIEIKPRRWGWRVFEVPGVEPVFLEKRQAIDYAQTRACFRSGEVRILDSTGKLERTIAFNVSEQRRLACVERRMKITIGFAVAALAFVFLCGVDAGRSEEQLAKEAKITRSEAEHIALSKVPHGRVSSGELEREHGTLIWSFDIAKPGTRDINEVQVDAKTGKIVSVKTETPKDQAEEAAADKKKK
jgi:hypothetical protein